MLSETQIIKYYFVLSVKKIKDNSFLDLPVQWFQKEFDSLNSYEVFIFSIVYQYGDYTFWGNDPKIMKNRAFELEYSYLEKYENLANDFAQNKEQFWINFRD